MSDSLAVAGLIGEETVETGQGTTTHLGGSGCYAALGASLVGRTQLIGVTSEDCLKDLRALSSGRAIDISRLQICPGRGFRYAVSYMGDDHSLRSFHAEWGMNPLFDYPRNTVAARSTAFLAADDPARQLRFVRGCPSLIYGVGINEHFVPDFRVEYIELMAMAQLVVLNRREWYLLGLAELDLETTIIVTDGSRPIVVHSGGESFEQAVQTESCVVDPSGCGDVLGGASFALWSSAGFAIGHLRESISRAIRESQLALKSRGALGLMQMQEEAKVA